MNLKKLFEMQKKLDERIVKEHGLLGEELKNDKVLALLVELGELANETRCFKFWSNKSSSERSVILEEYVDGVHFFISLGIEKGESLFENVIVRKHTNGLTTQFNELFKRVSELYEWNHKNVCYVFGLYVGLGEMLGFTWDEVEQAYMDKNKINHERQSEGY